MAKTEAAMREGTDSGIWLESEQGVTTISADVVGKLAGFAARETAGVHNLGSSFRRLVGRVKPGSDSLTQGVNVEVGKREAAVDIVIVVEYGHAIPDLAQSVRDNIIAAVEKTTGLVVKEVNIEVDDIVFEQESATRVE